METLKKYWYILAALVFVYARVFVDNNKKKKRRIKTAYKSYRRAGINKKDSLRYSLKKF